MDCVVVFFARLAGANGLLFCGSKSLIAAFLDVAMEVSPITAIVTQQVAALPLSHSTLRANNGASYKSLLCIIAFKVY